jgi:hypothetical protein
MRRSDAKPRMLSPVLSFEGGMEGTSRTHEARANGRHDNPILRASTRRPSEKPTSANFLAL